MSEFKVDYKRLSQIKQSVGLGGLGDLHVVLLYGGMSAEREVSIMSGEVVCNIMKEMNYRVTPVDMGSDIAEVLRKLNPDVVLNALHGTFGEDGCVQGLLEILGIPYTHSGVLASAISKGDNLSTEPMNRPYVIKPLNQGSSLGVEVIFCEDDYNLSKYDFPYGDKAIIEEYIEGKEIQVAVLNSKAVGTLEIICLNGKRFNDYDCKYKEGYSKHICPANVSKEANDEMMRIAENIHKIMNCKGVTRVEFRYNSVENKAYFLEINTHPGLTLLSSAPDIIQQNGISFKNFLEILIDEALQ